VLIGAGEAEQGGERRSGSTALRRAGLEPLALAAKEAVSLINGTQAMLAIGCLELLAAERLADNADLACALSLDALHGTPRAFDEALHAARPHPGQVAVARNLKRLIEGSEIRASHLGCRRVQDAYSLRCAPQVHGAVRDALREARRVFTIELNSATDNPLVLGEEVISGGNFHGEILAFQLDFLAIALAALAGISERRIERMVNPALSEGLPPFLAANPGLESGLMMAQVTAAALVGEMRVLATPASPGSITTDGNKEDFVSMGMTAALKLRQAVELARTVLAIEMIAGVRALEFSRPLKTSPALESVRGAVAEMTGPVEGDQPLSAPITRVAEWLKAPRG
ncbi:MAG: HAL/PAL/TAL family ammonia-lyase, partial [Bryobacteraceae bacterium]